MRGQLLLLVVLASAAWAGEGGVWTGYVNGWVKDPGSRSTAYVPVAPLNARALLLQSAWLNEQQLMQLRLQSLERRDPLPSPAPTTTSPPSGPSQTELLLQQQVLSLQQQLLLQQQLTQKEAAAPPSMPAVKEPAVAVVPTVSSAAPASPEVPALAAEVSPAPVKGPDVLRWTDRDGVTHFSTKPPKDRSVAVKNTTAALRKSSAVVERQDTVNKP
jgi:Domain of unknown function (DUF4124)